MAASGVTAGMPEASSGLPFLGTRFAIGVQPYGTQPRFTLGGGSAGGGAHDCLSLGIPSQDTAQQPEQSRNTEEMTTAYHIQVHASCACQLEGSWRLDTQGGPEAVRALAFTRFLFTASPSYTLNPHPCT